MNFLIILDQKSLLHLAFPLPKDVLPKVATKTTSSALGKFERKMSGRGTVRAGKRLTIHFK